MIHVAGPISDVSEITLEDEAFAVSVKGSVKLKRLVEMLQERNSNQGRKKVKKIPKILRDFHIYKYGVISTSTQQFQDPSIATALFTRVKTKISCKQGEDWRVQFTKI